MSRRDDLRKSMEDADPIEVVKLFVDMGMEIDDLKAENKRLSRELEAIENHAVERWIDVNRRRPTFGVEYLLRIRNGGYRVGTLREGCRQFPREVTHYTTIVGPQQESDDG